MRLSLAPWSCRPEASLGRVVPEPESPLRTCWQRDRDRIVHATAFRRLEYKTQVFANFEGDHYRTRLTHSLEVAQITRTVARALAVDEDLAEAIALAHDLGHSAFGHAGERALDAALAAWGGFDHNLQTFRIVTALERRYAAFDGLNLTFETLEGVVKHNGPARPPLPSPIAEHPLASRIDLFAQPPVEAQIAALADDVAYCSHDVDDGLRAGFFALEELLDLPRFGAIVRAVLAAHPGLERSRLAHETHRRLIDAMVGDLVDEARRRLAATAPDSPAAVRRLERPVVAFSEAMREPLAALREFLAERVYRHYKVNRMARKAERLVSDLVRAFLEAPDCLPDHWRARAHDPASTAAAVRDYVAGMTDRYAIDEHDRLFKMERERP
ncbi:MAG: deoxyguanosinetriphosphate triphosphohydrolase [Geminicoccaceae bacterium]|nr:deoxyguanosinetriphosphate triphosphohydrolase [Geminicoccaceae bacterium]